MNDLQGPATRAHYIRKYVTTEYVIMRLYSIELLSVLLLEHI